MSSSVPEPPRAPSEAVTRSGQVSLLDGSVIVLDLDSFVDDRGVLTPITFDEWGFRAARAFVVSAPPGAVRGGHAHKHVRQVLFRASGEIELELRSAGAHVAMTLDGRRPAVLLEAGVWARQTYVAADSTLIVFADGPYDRTEYVSAEEALS